MKIFSPEIKIGDTVTEELLDWIDNVKSILNQGKYSLYISSSIPTNTGNNGDTIIYTDGATVRRLYSFYDSAWRYINFDG